MTKQFETVVLQVAEAAGAVVVEHFICPKCGTPQHTAHLFIEVLECQDRACGGRCASKVHRPPQPGELTLAHLQQAMETLHATYEQQQKAELPPITREEIAALPTVAQLALARQSVAASRHVLEKSVALAEELAKLDGNTTE